MVTLSFRSRDVATLIAVIVLVLVLYTLSEPPTLTTHVGLIGGLVLVMASVLLGAYFNAQRLRRTWELAGYRGATPLSSLRDIVIRDLIVARRELTNARAEAEELRAAAVISQLDRESILALMRTASRPSGRQIWIDRSAGFLLGITSSLLASYVFAALQSHGSS